MTNSERRALANKWHEQRHDDPEWELVRDCYWGMSEEGVFDINAETPMSFLSNVMRAPINHAERFDLLFCRVLEKRLLGETK